MNILLKENTHNIKRKQKLLLDKYFQALLNISLKYVQYEITHEFIRDLLTINHVNYYEEYLKTYEDDDIILDDYLYDLYNLFREWKPFEHYNLSECRGVFFEEFTFKYLERIHENDMIYTESKVVINNYVSHTWDIIIKLREFCLLYECKYSPYSIKRKHLDNIVSLKNKLNNSKVYLVVYSNRFLVEYVIKKLRQNTGEEKYQSNIQLINIFTQENFMNLDLL